MFQISTDCDKIILVNILQDLLRIILFFVVVGNKNISFTDKESFAGSVGKRKNN